MGNNVWRIVHIIREKDLSSTTIVKERLGLSTDSDNDNAGVLVEMKR